jgi:hypothetical protein
MRVKPLPTLTKGEALKKVMKLKAFSFGEGWVRQFKNHQNQTT